MDGFFKSKTNVQILLSVLLSLALVLVGIGVEVLFDKSVFEYIALGVGKLFGDSSVAAYRNVKADTPVRLMEAETKQANEMVDIAARAKEKNVELPPTWRPK